MSVHPVANGRRWVLGIGTLLIAGAPVGVLTILIANSWIAPGFGRVMGYSFVIVVAALPLAVTQLAKATSGGFAESYEIYERGLVHVRWGTRRSWTWDQVYGVVAAEKDLSPRFGWDFGCVVSFHGGARLQFNGLTRNARAIAETLKSRCPQAVGKQHDSRWEDILPWLTPVVAIALGLTTWWAVDYILTNEEQSDVLSPGYVAGVERLSDSALGGLTVLIFVCGLGFLASAVTAIWVIVDRIRYG